MGDDELLHMTLIVQGLRGLIFFGYAWIILSYKVRLFTLVDYVNFILIIFGYSTTTDMRKS